MDITNENQEDTALLTQGDLALAAYALSEVYNSYLERYNEQDFGDSTKEQMEKSMTSLRISFTKFDSILKVMVNKGEGNESKSKKA
tara:strand:- start:580 stop:837 length:258 start_codon:yes stop_codon:yes gene_type:complete